MINVTRKTQLNIGDCLYYKNLNSNCHKLATYVCKVIDVKPHIIEVRMKPIVSTMEEIPYIGSFPRTYKSSICKNDIGTEGVSLKLEDMDFDISNPEKEARLICENNGVTFVDMVGIYGFRYQTKGIDFTDSHISGDVYEDDIRLFYMEECWNSNTIAKAS